MGKKRKWLEFWGHSLDSLTNIGMEISVALIVVLMLGLTIHSIGRYFFSKSLLWFMELGSYMFLGIVFLALALTQKTDHHIKVDILTSHLPGGILRHLRGLFVPVICLIYVVFFIWGSLLMTWRFYYQDAVGFELPSMPLFIPALVIPVGLLMLVFVLITTVIHYVRQMKSSKQQLTPEKESKRKAPI